MSNLIKVIIEIPYQCSCTNDCFYTNATSELVKKLAKENACIDIKEYCEKNNLESICFEDVPHMGQDDLIEKLKNDGYFVFKDEEVEDIRVSLDW